MSVRQKIEDSSILYIEDDGITRQQLSKFLKKQCRTLYIASNGKEGMELFHKYIPDIVITDIEMPKINGLELSKKIRKISLSTQIIIITAYKKPEYLMEAVNLQLVQYLVKPINIEKITQVLEVSEKFLKRRSVKTKRMLSDGVYYDTYTKELLDNSNVISLSKYERTLIELLIKKHPAPVSYDLINAQIYDFSASKNAIKLLVSSLREKVKKQSIINVSGFGYKLNFINQN